MINYYVDPGSGFVFVQNTSKEPSIIDIAPTLLGLFEMTKPEEMQGRVLFRDEIE